VISSSLRTRLQHLWRALTRGRQLDAAMDDEMRFHVEMEAERLVRERGLHRREAQRLARVAFGGVEKFKEAGRDTRGLRSLDTLSLDARLALRMLVKHRGLTVVGGFAMAVAIGIGATAFQVFSEVLKPALPFGEGDRIVAVRLATRTPGSAERRVLHDFVALREQLRSIQELGAFRSTQQNLAAGGAGSEPVQVAEITASAFLVARTPPLLGRYLLPDDERAAAADALVIGYDAWQVRFAGDPHVVGRSVILGGAPATIVGVMPKGFLFPIDHQYWTAFRADPLKYRRLEGPAIHLFGRLAPGATFAAAQSELDAYGRRAAREHPATHAELRPLVLPYTHEHLDVTEPFRRWLLRATRKAEAVISATCTGSLPAPPAARFC
jgi:putative ABC transport system permease protein